MSMKKILFYISFLIMSSICVLVYIETMYVIAPDEMAAVYSSEGIKLVELYLLLLYNILVVKPSSANKNQSQTKESALV